MIRLGYITLLALCAVALISCSNQNSDQKTDIRVLSYASAYSPNHPFSQGDMAWMKYIEDRSNGQIKIRPYWSGSLISESESMNEIRHGVTDIGGITPIYTLGGAHLLRVQSGFYSGVTGYENQTALYRCMEAEGNPFAEELHGLKVLALQGGNNPGIIMRDKPVQKLSDLKGLRIRVPSELIPVLRRLEADPVEMPMGEVYSALAKGVIDGVIAPAETFGSLHFEEVAKYYTQLRVPRSAYPARAMSEKVWKSLTLDQQEIFNESILVWEAAISEQTKQADRRGHKVAKDAGIIFLPISSAEQIRFNEVYLNTSKESAYSMKRFDLDAVPIFNVARGSVQPDGKIICKGQKT